MTNEANKSGLEPRGRAVLLKPYDVAAVTTGGIILPRSVQEQGQVAEQRALVVEVGPGAWRDEPEPRAKVGDKIIFSKWAGYIAEGPLDGETYRVVNDSDIFLRIREA